MPAREEEVHHAEEEGIEFHMLTNPVRIIAGEDKWVKAIECVRMELGEPDESGRRRPVEIKGSNFIMDVDTVILAIGQRPNPILQATTPGLSMSKRGTVVVDKNCQTSRPGNLCGRRSVPGRGNGNSGNGRRPEICSGDTRVLG